MIVTLIGMSNCGKSYWSHKLESAGFTRFSCDDMIENKLEKELVRVGYSGLDDLAKWMGQPYDKQYPIRSREYLKLEKEALLEIINGIKGMNNKCDAVIDTTGSFIYHDEFIIRSLRNISKIIYLLTPNKVVKEMCELYFRKPKPVYWGKSYQKKLNESSKEALVRCYPNLLSFRSSEYNKIAQMTLDYFLLRSEDFHIGDFVKLTQKK